MDRMIVSRSSPPRRVAKRSRIALLIHASNNFNRRIILGASAYGRNHGGWEFFYPTASRNDLHLPKGEVTLPEGWHGDGILFRCTSDSILSTVNQSQLPAVNVSWRGLRHSNVTSVIADPTQCGEMVADYLNSKHFDHFGYVGVPEWQGYNTDLPDAIRHRIGSRLLEFEFPDREHYRLHLRTELENWLASLPKPIGIITWSTDQARILISICQENGIVVPNEVSVVTCEYDELSAALAPISISGIFQDPSRVGFEAAKTLHGLMDGNRPATTITRIDPIDVIERDSSRTAGASDEFIQRCLGCVEQGLDTGINTTKLAQLMDISRRTLEIKLRRSLNKSPSAVIDEAKLRRAKEMLSDTDRPLDEIANRTGFSSVSAFSRFFKRKLNTSPSAYRHPLGTGGFDH